MNKNICTLLPKSGFTLIELAIVLVVIGLVVGGIFAGQDLITAAIIRKQIAQFNEVESSINTFKDKYAGLPGDLSNATNFFGTTDARGYTVANGNGDGIILSSLSVYLAPNNLTGPGTQFVFGSIPNEVEEVFHHLNLAGLINYDISTPAIYVATALTKFPDSVTNGSIFVTSIDNNTISSTNFQQGTAIIIGGDNTSLSRYASTRITYVLGFGGINPPLLPPGIAYRLDSKLDDGLPQTGKIGIGFICGGSGPPATYQAIATNCNVSLFKVLWK